MGRDRGRGQNHPPQPELRPASLSHNLGIPLPYEFLGPCSLEHPEGPRDLPSIISRILQKRNSANTFLLRIEAFCSSSHSSHEIVLRFFILCIHVDICFSPASSASSAASHLNSSPKNGIRRNLLSPYAHAAPTRRAPYLQRRRSRRRLLISCRTPPPLGRMPSYNDPTLRCV